MLYASVFTAIGVAVRSERWESSSRFCCCCSVGASRARTRVWLGDQYLSILKRASRPKVLIYGADTTGRLLAAATANSHEMQVMEALDGDDRLHGQVLNGQAIYNPADLDNLATTLNIRDVLLAMPCLNRMRLVEMALQALAATQVSKQSGTISVWCALPTCRASRARSSQSFASRFATAGPLPSQILKSHATS